MVELAPNWAASERRHAASRRAFYLSAEYLVGRMVFNNLLAMGVLEEVRELLSEKGVDLNSLEDVEDMALGNGGLGRLAACFLGQRRHARHPAGRLRAALQVRPLPPDV